MLLLVKMLRLGLGMENLRRKTLNLLCRRKADVIIGPIGIVIADALHGEISPAMALAVGQSNAKRILIPVNHCDNMIVGVSDLSMTKLIAGVIEELKKNAC